MTRTRSQKRSFDTMINDGQAHSLILNTLEALNLELGEACAVLDQAYARLLIQHGANVNARCRDTQTPFTLCFGFGGLGVPEFTDFVDFLLKQGAICSPDLQSNVLMSVCENRHVNTLRLLLQHGFRFQSTYILLTMAKNQLIDYYEVMDTIFETKDISPDIQDSDGRTLLYLATMSGKIDIVASLLKHGANPNIPSRRGWTPLLRSASFVQGVSHDIRIGIWKLLATHGANIDEKTRSGKTAFDLCVQQHADLREFFNVVKQKRFFAFLSGFHTRLGVDSPLALMPCDLLPNILDHFVNKQ